MVPRTTSHDHPKVRLAPRRVPARAADDTPGRRRGERGGDDRDGPDEPDPARDTGDLEDDPQHLTGHQRERPREQAEHDSKREHGHARHAEVVAFGPSAGEKGPVDVGDERCGKRAERRVDRCEQRDGPSTLEDCDGGAGRGGTPPSAPAPARASCLRARPRWPRSSSCACARRAPRRILPG